ncbi:protein unc-13 homolog isoform X1 [Nicotiana tabacum]|uniref:protein unc-13 homolog isoform X1 n=1 Tax=Nicotiana tabacum TaxID=4097 RepID=UPI003F4EEBB0
METNNSLLQRYRDDRRKLLEFLLSCGLIREIRTPSGPTFSLSNINLDVISADYVLECVQFGGVLDVSLAAKKYHNEHRHPKTLHTGDVYFLVTDPEAAGSHPQRVPPPIMKNHSNNNGPCHSDRTDFSLYGDDHGVDSKATGTAGSFPIKQADLPSIGMPVLKTGLLDDDLRESAYEVFLGCMVCSGLEIRLAEGKKKEKSPRFLAGLKNKREKRHSRSMSGSLAFDRNAVLIETFRTQMQISEAMDALIRRKLVRLASGKSFGQIDVAQIALGLLNGTMKSEFQNEKSYIQWKNRQANILEELLSAEQSVGTLFAKIRNFEEWDIKMSPSECRDVLFSIRNVALTLSSMPGNLGIQGETYYWSAGYPFNIRLYQKLLLGVFDILEDGRLIEEADEILKLIKSTWPLLGITQKLHDVLYGWVLFQQFVGTEEAMLLDYAVRKVRNILSPEDAGKKETKYLESLVCCTHQNGSEIRLNLVQSILWSISLWCDNKLLDYHWHFRQKPCLFKGVLSMALVAGNQKFDASGNMELMLDASDEIIASKVRMYAERSAEAACNRVTGAINAGSKVDKKHPLALLASELKSIAEKQLTVYHPVLRHWCAEAGVVSALKLHRFYGERLEPFLKNISCLSEDVKQVLAAAILLENYLLELHSSERVENGVHSPLMLDFERKIGEIARPIILDWVIAQHARILEWTGRAADLEDWEPLSHQQKQAASAVEVFRIIEETIDQFFELRLPVDITHLQALLSIIFHTLDAYLQKVVNQLVDNHNLYPPAPPLTRYKEMAFPSAKKKLVESVVLDNAVNKKLEALTTSKLCVRMNTLQYMQKKISTLEDGIRESWSAVRLFKNQTCPDVDSRWTSNGILEMCSESVDELFVATFDCIRDSAADAIRKTCELVGARVMFWDLREPFIFNLYHGGVEGARLETMLPQFDRVLNNVCALIDDTLRDIVVKSIFKASLEGYAWVLLDGGPSRAFSDFDVVMMEDDLNILKDLFVAEGEGLPRSLVEEEARFAHQILSLFSLRAESVIQLLMTSSEHSSIGLEAHKFGHRHLGDAHTLIRVLCHKKEREASKFLKLHYHLPASSVYDEAAVEDASVKSPLMADLIKRSASFRWSDKGSSSFRSLKKKIQEATSDFRHVGW